jgi:alpha-1,2-mannosyltransferase
MPRSRGLGEAYGLRRLRERRFQLVVAATLLVILLAVRIVQVLIYSTQIQWGYDFSAYWSAAGRVIAGDALYWPEQLAGPYSPQQQYLYLYPPAFAVAMTPVALVFDDYRVANWLWAAIGAVLLAATVVLVGRSERLLSGRTRILLVGAAFVFPPVVGELVMGNVHLLVLALLAGAWLAIRGEQPRGRGEVIAGALVGVAAMIKIFPGLVILWFVLRRRWTAALAATLTMGALVIATLPIVGLQPWLDYPTVLLNLGPPVDSTDTVAPSVWLSTFLPPSAARVVVIGIGLAIVLWTSTRRAEPVSYAVAVVVSVLIAPALYHHYLAILVLPMLLAIRWAPPLWWLGLAYIAMFGGEQEALGDAVWIVNRLLPTVGALAVLVGLSLRGSPSSPSASSSRAVGAQ